MNNDFIYRRKLYDRAQTHPGEQRLDFGAAPAVPLRPLDETGFTALDIETTGLSPAFCGIVEIAALKVLPGGESQTFQTLVDPHCVIPRAVTAIHGISSDMVRGAPCAEEVVGGLIEFAAGTPLVLHNAPFDLGFLTPIVQRQGLAWRSPAVFDTLRLAKRAFPGLRSYSLENLSRFFDFDAGNHHRALADCEYCARLFQLIRAKLRTPDGEESFCRKCASSPKLLGM